MKIELRNWFNGKVIFRYECQNNTIKKTVEEAVKQGVSLAYAYLPGEDLSGGKLAGADLVVADLTKANLSNTDLTGADFDGSELTEANLVGAKLDKAKLRNTDLSGAKFSEEQKDIILKAIGVVFNEGKDSK